MANLKFSNLTTPSAAGGTPFATAKAVGLTTPYPGQTFSDWIGATTPTDNWQFGTTASTGTTVKNATDLALYFNPLEKYTQDTVIASHLQRWQQFSDTTAFNFQTDHLALSAYLPSGSYDYTAVGICNNNFTASGSIAVASTLGAANNTPFSVGQILIIQYGGIFRITAKTSTTNITLELIYGSTTISTNWAWIAPPIHATKLTADFNFGATTMSVDTVPATTITGFWFQPTTGTNDTGGKGDLSVASTGANSITLNKANDFNTVTSGKFILFVPPLKSAQFWTKKQWQSGASSSDGRCNIFATELVAQMPGNGTNTNIFFNDIAAQNTSEAFGAWPAYWMYSGDLGGTRRSDAEIDIFEFYNCSTIGMNRWTGIDHGSGVGVRIFTSGDVGGVGDIDLGYQSNAAFRKYQLVWTPTHTYKFVDDVMIQKNQFQWTASAWAELGVSMQVGSMNNGLAQALLLPFKQTNLSTMKLKVKSLKTWVL